MHDKVYPIDTLLDMVASKKLGQDLDPRDQILRDVIYTLAPRYIELTDSTDQPIANTNTPQVITFNTEDAADGFEHSGGVVTASIDMPAIDVILSLEADSGGGTSNMYTWVELNIQDGNGFVALANSAERIKLSANDEDIIILDRIVPNFKKGHQIRFMLQGTSVQLSLKHETVDGSIPAVPSASLSITKV